MTMDLLNRRNMLKGFVLVGALGASISELYAAYGNPKTWALTVGTTSQQLLANNGARIGLIFHNPNAVGGASVAFCGAYDGGPAGDGVAVINGNGCITVPPGGYIVAGNEIKWTGAINGIASSSSTAFTILEF